MDLSPFIVFGAVLVLAVAAMIAWRQTVARREDDTLHVLSDAGAVPEQVSVAQKLDVIDKWGKLLTVVTAIYVVVVGGLYVYQQWVRASNLGV